MSTVATLVSPINPLAPTPSSREREQEQPLAVRLAIRLEREAAFVRWLESQARRYASRGDEPRCQWLASHLFDLARDARLVCAADGLELDGRLEVLGRGHVPTRGEH